MSAGGPVRVDTRCDAPTDQLPWALSKGGGVGVTGCSNHLRGCSCRSPSTPGWCLKSSTVARSSSTFEVSEYHSRARSETRERSCCSSVGFIFAPVNRWLTRSPRSGPASVGVRVGRVASIRAHA